MIAVPKAVEDILKDRQSTHGDFREVARVEQGLKNVLRSGTNWLLLDPDARCALDMFAHKMARVVEGDPKFRDHWDDIEGYARCVSRNL